VWLPIDVNTQHGVALADRVCCRKMVGWRWTLPTGRSRGDPIAAAVEGRILERLLRR
jgi:hypothetical protein